MLIVYTDGACAPSNPGPCAWGAVLISGNDTPTEHFGFIGHGTNQVAELTAALQGLLLTPRGAAVELVSDSQYVLKGITEWRAGWERNGWRNSKKEPVANLEIWQRLFAAVDARKVTTRWVKGHNDDRFNELADRLANAGLKAKKAAPAPLPDASIPIPLPALHSGIDVAKGATALTVKELGAFLGASLNTGLPRLMAEFLAAGDLRAACAVKETSEKLSQALHALQPCLRAPTAAAPIQNKMKP